MPNEIRHKTSTTASAVPTAAQLAQGELAVNAASGKVYTKKVDNTVVDLTDPLVMDGGAQFTPLDVSNLALWLDGSDASTLYTTDAGPVTAVTAPTDIAGCVGWWDASDASTLFQDSAGTIPATAADAPVGRWANKISGRPAATQATSTARPLLKLASVNNRNAVLFDGVDDLLNASVTGSSTHTWLFVGQWFTTPGNGSATIGLNATASIMVQGGMLYWYSNSSGGYIQLLPAVTPTLGQRFITGWTNNNATVTLRHNGFQLASGSAAATAINANGVIFGGRQNAAGSFQNVYFCEVLQFSSALSSTNLARLERYLANKWGITELHQQLSQLIPAVSSPTDIGNCALWLDAADAATVTLSGNAVTQWADKSGNARNFTAALTACPTYTATINSRSVLTFDGVANTLTGNSAAQTAIQNITGYTCFAVVRPNSVAAGERFVLGFGGGTVIYRLGQQDSRPFIGGRRTGAETLRSVTAASGTLTLGGTYVLSSVVNHPTTTLTGFSRGVSFGTDTAYMDAGNTPATALPVNVGTQGGGTYGFFSGDIAELIVFNVALSATDRARIEKYLAAKWGGTSGIEPTPGVGAWYDKSGNARHATQTTAANRPTISATTINARNTLTWNGSTSRLRTTTSAGMGQTMSLFAVVKRGPTTWGGGGGGGFGTILGAGTSNQGPNLMVDNGVMWLTGGTNKSVFTPAGALGVTAPALFSGTLTSGTTALYVNSVLADADPVTGTGTDAGAIEMGAYNPSTQGGGPLAADIAELITYSRVLTAAERRRVEQYLATKWGLNIVPQVANIDAQDWLNRVYLAGSTVSPGTAAAVNNFCNAIDAAGIRDRFYRLNLFCGDNLTACLVPLYRGPALTATQLGNATDTNVNFSSADYVESGSGGGLLGNGSSKYLQTGIAPSAWVALNLGSHLSVYKRTPVNSGALLGAGIRAAAAAQNQVWEFGGGGNGAGGRSGSFGAPGTHNALLGVTRTFNTGSQFVRAFRNDQFSQDNAATEQVVAISLPFAVFARNSQAVDGTTYSISLYSNQLLAAYSVGLHLTNDVVAAYNTAMQNFQSALSRAVT